MNITTNGFCELNFEEAMDINGGSKFWEAVCEFGGGIAGGVTGGLAGSVAGPVGTVTGTVTGFIAGFNAGGDFYNNATN